MRGYQYYINGDPVYQSALFAYEDATEKFLKARGELETENAPAYQALVANWHISRDALDAAINGFISRKLAEALNPNLRVFEAGELLL